MKMFMGNLTNWWKHTPLPEFKPEGLGYIIRGTFEGHPWLDGEDGCTSWVVRHDEALGLVETLNSYYKLIGPPIKAHVKAGT